MNAYTAAGAAIAEVVDGALEALGLRTDKDEFLHRYTNKGRAIFERWCIAAAFESLGLELGEDGAITERSITQAVNSQLGGEFEFTNVFDKEAIKRDIKREALQRVNEQSGLNLSSLSTKALKQAARRVLSEKLREQAAAGAGALLDAMPDDAGIVAMVESFNTSRFTPSTAPDAEHNRQRQARFRANNARAWRAK